MTHVSIDSDKVNVDLNLKIEADWLTCLIPALLAGLPSFIEAFMKCIAGDATPGEYNPGDRPRCN